MKTLRIRFLDNWLDKQTLECISPLQLNDVQFTTANNFGRPIFSFRKTQNIQRRSLLPGPRFVFCRAESEHEF